MRVRVEVRRIGKKRITLLSDVREYTFEEMREIFVAEQTLTRLVPGIDFYFGAIHSAKDDTP
jgi:predicted DNA-binding protein